MKNSYLSIYDTDLDESSVAKFISDNPEMKGLDFIGEIRLDWDDVDHKIKSNGSTYYGDLIYLKLIWAPNEDDLIQVEKNGGDKKTSDLFKVEVIEKKKKYDIYSLLKAKSAEKINHMILERFS